MALPLFTQVSCGIYDVCRRDLLESANVGGNNTRECISIVGIALNGTDLVVLHDLICLALCYGLGARFHRGSRRWASETRARGCTPESKSRIYVRVCVDMCVCVRVRVCVLCVCVCFVCVWCVMVAVNVEAAVNKGQSHDDDTGMPALRGLSAAWLGAFWHGREGTGT